MKQLNPNWLTEGSIDFEYKKYRLLAYLQHISKHFDQQKLYPFLAELILHHQNLINFRSEKKQATEKFPAKFKKIDLEKFRIEYERVIDDNEYLSEVENIINFALPQLEYHLKSGKEIYDFVEDKLEIQPIGIQPLTTDFGYLFLVNGNNKNTKVFNYELSIFNSSEAKYRAIKTNYIDSYIKRFANTYEAIKLDLIKKNKNLPNPATYVISSSFTFPLEETLLPIAKRTFMRFLATANSI